MRRVHDWDSDIRAVPPMHPGELLREEFMKPRHLTPAMLAMAIPPRADCSQSDIAETIRAFMVADEDAVLDIDLALALDCYFGLTPGFFWRVQAEHEIRDWSQEEKTWLSGIRAR